MRKILLINIHKEVVFFRTFTRSRLLKCLFVWSLLLLFAAVHSAFSEKILLLLLKNTHHQHLMRKVKYLVLRIFMLQYLCELAQSKLLQTSLSAIQCKSTKEKT